MIEQFEDWLVQQPWHAEDPHVVLGLRLGYVEPRDLYLESIHVLPSMRKKGIARAVMAKLIAIANAHDAPLTLEVDETSSSRWILDWYLRLGFTYHDLGAGDYGPYLIHYPPSGHR